MSPRIMFEGSYTCFTFQYYARTCLFINRDVGRRAGVGPALRILVDSLYRRDRNDNDNGQKVVSNRVTLIC